MVMFASAICVRAGAASQAAFEIIRQVGADTDVRLKQNRAKSDPRQTEQQSCILQLQLLQYLVLPGSGCFTQAMAAGSLGRRTPVAAKTMRAQSACTRCRTNHNITSAALAALSESSAGVDHFHHIL
jgi:hypothetical protein